MDLCNRRLSTDRNKNSSRENRLQWTETVSRYCQTSQRMAHYMCNVMYNNVNVKFKITLHKQVWYRGTLQYKSYNLSRSWTLWWRVRCRLQVVAYCVDCKQRKFHFARTLFLALAFSDRPTQQSLNISLEHATRANCCPTTRPRGAVSLHPG